MKHSDSTARPDLGARPRPPAVRRASPAITWIRLGRLSLGLALLWALTIACSSRPLPTPTAPALADKLIFYNWSDDMPQSVLDAFTAEYGVRVYYQTFDTMEAAVANIEAGQVYDVVNLDNRFIPALMQTGHLAELNFSRLSNLKNISPNFRDLVYDPGNRYTVPYNWGTTGLVIRKDRLAEPVTSWADLWDPQYAGKVALWLGQPREVLGLTLRSLGYSANSESPAELEAALERLRALKPNARWLDSGINSLSTLLESGEVVIGMGYSGDVLLARETTPAIDYVLPSEGALLWGENFVIPANGPRQATAELFLNFILRPEIAAQIANENFYATPNEAAFTLIRPEIFNDPIIFPPNAALQQAEIVLPLSPAGQQLHDQIWATFLATAAP